MNEPVYPIIDIVLRKGTTCILYRSELLDPDDNHIFYKVVKPDGSMWTTINISDAYKLFDKIEKEA